MWINSWKKKKPPHPYTISLSNANGAHSFIKSPTSRVYWFLHLWTLMHPIGKRGTKVYLSAYWNGIAEGQIRALALGSSIWRSNIYIPLSFAAALHYFGEALNFFVKQSCLATESWKSSLCFCVPERWWRNVFLHVVQFLLKSGKFGVKYEYFAQFPTLFQSYKVTFYRIYNRNSQALRSFAPLVWICPLWLRLKQCHPRH